MLQALAQEFIYRDDTNTYISTDFIELEKNHKSISIMALYHEWRISGILEGDTPLMKSINTSRFCDLCGLIIVDFVHDITCHNLHKECAKICADIVCKVINNYVDTKLTIKTLFNSTKHKMHNIYYFKQKYSGYNNYSAVIYDNRYIETYELHLSILNTVYDGHNIYELLDGIDDKNTFCADEYLCDNCDNCINTEEHYYFLDYHLCNNCDRHAISFKNFLIEKFMIIIQLCDHIPNDVIKMIFNIILSIYNAIITKQDFH